MKLFGIVGLAIAMMVGVVTDAKALDPFPDYSGDSSGWSQNAIAWRNSVNSAYEDTEDAYYDAGFWESMMYATLEAYNEWLIEKDAEGFPDAQGIVYGNYHALAWPHKSLYATQEALFATNQANTKNTVYATQVTSGDNKMDEDDEAGAIYVWGFARGNLWDLKPLYRANATNFESIQTALQAEWDDMIVAYELWVE